jgi:16S rRNA (adenine(1408)-N(1))-methyltransferase
VVVDIGTGDGLFVYNSARQNPNKLFIGIDANARALRRISEKIHRSARKAGVANLLFVRATVERLPEDIHGLATEIFVLFPWASLLGAIVSGNTEVLSSIRALCSKKAVVKIVIALDSSRDAAELDRLALDDLSVERIDKELRSLFLMAGLQITDRREDPELWSEFRTSWSKRLRGNRNRKLICITAVPYS